MSFATWIQAGFPTVIPVVPPGATFSAFSKMEPSQAGKSPGRRNAQGLWTGLKDWTTVAATPNAVAEWETWGANIGLRTRDFPAVDIDVTDAALAEEIQLLAVAHLGDAPTRTGRAPKRTLLYRADTPLKRQRLWLTRDGTTHLVEVLGDGQQFVVEGIHPGTRKPFTWENGGLPIRADALFSLTPERVTAFLEAAAARATALGYQVRREGAKAERAVVAQTALHGTREAVTAAVSRLPNTSALFPTREDYLKVGYAIKAALPAHPGEAFDLWWAWCQRWEGNAKGGNDLERAQADWSRMAPPYAIGAPWLYELARDHGFHDAQEEFTDDLPCAGPEFPAAAERVVEAPQQPPTRAEEVQADTHQSGAVAFSDAWLAHRFLARHGARVRYCERLGGWMRWDGHRWAGDDTGLTTYWAGRVLRAASQTAVITIEDPTEARSTAKFCCSEKARRNVMQYAAVDPAVAVSVDAFDTDPWALNTPAGIVNLRTGALEPADAARLFTRCTAVAPAPIPTPRWTAFLAEATHGDPDLARYLQRLAGYALTGSTREHVLAFLWGPGGNGKGVFLNTLVRLAGSYASVAAMDTFTSSRFDRHPTELAALFGARLVTAQETQEGRSWDEAKVKSITGGDPITARYMRQDFFTFLPQFKLLFAGNHKPHIGNLDDAMRRRFHLVPFTVKPRQVDPDLAEKLTAEWPGILQWALEGCLAWQRDGLQPPAAVREATEAYFADEDPLGRWLEERTAPGPGTETRDLWADWQIWCGEQNERPGTQRGFIQALLIRNFQKWRHPTTRRHGLAGLRLAPDHEFSAPGDAALVEALMLTPTPEVI